MREFKLSEKETESDAQTSMEHTQENFQYERVTKTARWKFIY